jgi:hypothetical protein
MSEVLVKSIEISQSGISVKPSHCPGLGSIPDILISDNKNPFCILEKRICKYFVKVIYDIDEHDKTIECKIK